MWSAGVGEDAELADGEFGGVSVAEIGLEENTTTRAKPIQAPKKRPPPCFSGASLEGWWLHGIWLWTPNRQKNSLKVAF